MLSHPIDCIIGFLLGPWLIQCQRFFGVEKRIWKYSNILLIFYFIAFLAREVCPYTTNPLVFLKTFFVEWDGIKFCICSTCLRTMRLLCLLDEATAHAHSHTKKCDEDSFWCYSKPLCFLNIFASLIYKFPLYFPTSTGFSISSFISVRYLIKNFEVVLIWLCSEFMILLVSEFHLTKRDACCSTLTVELCHKPQIYWVSNMFENYYYGWCFPNYCRWICVIWW